MNERFHVIITGENGRSSSFQISKRSFFVTLTTTLVCLIAFGVFGYFTSGAYLNSKRLAGKVEALQSMLTESVQVSDDYRRQLAAIKKEHGDALAALQEQHETTIAQMRTSYDLENTNLQLENLRLMNTAVSDLNERSELIETVMHTIGVSLKPGKKVAQEGSGGPYIPAEQSSYDSLLGKVDDYLTTIRLMPLGRPVTSGSISSGFGKRNDPLNEKSAFHEGVDIRADRGEKVFATASGKVLSAGKNGGYGIMVEIDHGNGYRTIYAHLQSHLVKKGEVVKQGQIIGQVGDTGRSTGAHLHYEIRLNNKPINPTKFMKVADLARNTTARQE